MAEGIDPREPGWWTYVRMFKTGLEILAIVVAGTWAWFVFWEDTAPSLDKLLDINSNLTWSNLSDTSCEMEYAVSFKNLSKHRLEVKGARVRAWYMANSEMPTVTTPVVYLRPLDSREGDPIFDTGPVFSPDKNKPRDFDRLIGNFGPGEGKGEGFTFFVKPVPGKRIIFKTDLWSDDDFKKKKEKETWSDNRHEWVCGLAAPPKPN